MAHKTATLAAAGVFSLIVLANDKLAEAAWTVTGCSPDNNNLVFTDARGLTYRYRAATNDFIDAQNAVWTFREIVCFVDGTGIGMLTNQVNQTTKQFWDGGLALPAPKGFRAGTPSRVLHG